MSNFEMQALNEIFSEAFMQEEFDRWCDLMEAEYGGKDCSAF